MIRYPLYDFWQSSAQVLVNPVNCVGVMGAGIAKEFNEKYPAYSEDYRIACSSGAMKLGHLHRYRLFNDGRWIVSFPTKRHWRESSRIEWIDSGLRELLYMAEEKGFVSIAVPALGCGNGGLDWRDVQPLIEKHLGGLDCDVQVFPPLGVGATA